MPFVIALLALACLALPAHAADDPPPMLLGPCTVADLEAEPYAGWYLDNRHGYTPNPDMVAQLREAGAGELEVDAYFGSWCGDSKRELPRFLAVAEAAGLHQVDLVAVGREDELYKRSPGGEADGLEIYRVPTFVVRRGGQEIARIVESPVLSLERDLLAIASGQPYTPNYSVYTKVAEWKAAGLLDDPNVAPRGLANQLLGQLAGPGALASAAKAHRTRGETVVAVKLAEVNALLHGDEARVHGWLAEACLANGQPEDARDHVERALERNEDPDAVEGLLELLDRIGVAGAR